MDPKTQKILLLESFSILYNLIEAYLAILFGSFAGSIALIGFGLASTVEALYGLILVWRYNRGREMTMAEVREKAGKILTFAMITFFTAGGYVLFESLKRLVQRIPAHPSLPGLILAMISLLVTPLLLLKKYQTGANSSIFTSLSGAFLDLALPLTLFLGLAANYFLGFWQGDPFAGLFAVVFLFKKGLRG